MKRAAFRRRIKLQDRQIGENLPVFVIAEAGVNHFGSITKAKQLVDLSIAGGADAFKIQIFQTDLLVSRESTEWRDRLRPKELSYEQGREIREYCKSRGMLFLATAHEETSLAFIDSLDLPAYKIGSGEVNNWSFIREVAKRHKPVILSTGMYTLDEIGQALETIRSVDNHEVVVLHCVTLYPSPVEEVNLKAMDTIRKEFNVLVGYSDHTIGHEIPLAAVARGACVLEKHITIDKDIPNAQDWKVSCGPEDFPQLIRSVRRIEASIGSGIKFPSETEIKSKQWARKSLVAAMEIGKGEVVTPDKLCAKRPGYGIAPTERDKVLGRKAKRRIHKDTLIKWEHLVP